jgi:hypothetical protein
MSTKFATIIDTIGSKLSTLIRKVDVMYSWIQKLVEQLWGVPFTQAIPASQSRLDTAVTSITTLSQDLVNHEKYPFTSISTGSHWADAIIISAISNYPTGILPAAVTDVQDFMEYFIQHRGAYIQSGDAPIAGLQYSDPGSAGSVPYAHWASAIKMPAGGSLTSYLDQFQALSTGAINRTHFGTGVAIHPIYSMRREIEDGTTTASWVGPKFVLTIPASETTEATRIFLETSVAWPRTAPFKNVFTSGVVQFSNVARRPTLYTYVYQPNSSGTFSIGTSGTIQSQSTEFSYSINIEPYYALAYWLKPLKIKFLITVPAGSTESIVTVSELSVYASS